MDEKRKLGETEVETLRRERAHLLDELAMAYGKMQEALEVADEERRVAYEELSERNEQLQNRLCELEQAHGQLRDTQHMLVRSERLNAMGQMAATIVHELNNPLTVIQSYVELLIEGAGDEERDDLQALFRETQRMQGLAANVLRFARQRKSDTNTLNLNELVGEILEFFRPLVRNISLVVELAAGIPPIVGSGPQLKQILTNFLVNARDVLKKGRDQQIRVATGQATLAELIGSARSEECAIRMSREVPAADLAARWVYVEVADSGCGIEKTNLESVFEPFFTTKGEGGTGLGLAICAQIAAAHDGHIIIASRTGNRAGTRCWLLLPRQNQNGAQ